MDSRHNERVSVGPRTTFVTLIWVNAPLLEIPNTLWVIFPTTLPVRFLFSFLSVRPRLFLMAVSSFVSFSYPSILPCTLAEGGVNIITYCTCLFPSCQTSTPSSRPPNGSTMSGQREEATSLSCWSGTRRILQTKGACQDRWRASQAGSVVPFPVKVEMFLEVVL